MEPIPPVPETQPATSPPSTMSLAGRLLNVFAAPGEVFDGVKAAGLSNANWLLPAVLLIVASWISAFLIFSQPAIRQQVSAMTNQAIDRMVEKGKLPADRAEQARQTSEKMPGMSDTLGAAVGPVFTALVTPFWWGQVLWLGGKVLKGDFSCMKAVEAAGLANMILVLGVLVRTLLVLLTGNLFASPGLGLFVLKDFDPQNVVHSLLSVVNVMVLWLLLVRAIGLARLRSASVGKAAVWVFGIWAVLTRALIGLGAARRAAFGG
jgi:hypothetical protein